MKRMLVVYYSWTNGNTERIARQLAEAAGADLARIETTTSYRGTYDEVVAQTKREVDGDFTSEIAGLGAVLDDYDVIAVGTPTWWYTMAPAVKTFLRGESWSGRTVVPFMTNGGWPGHVIDDLEDECSGARFLEPMEVRFDSGGGDRMKTPARKAASWVEAVCHAIR